MNPRMLRLASAAVPCLGMLLAAARAQSPGTSLYSRSIAFSGYTWSVKSSSGRVGPGPNYFSDSSNNVWMDTNGRLHLKITKSGGRWYCAEVILSVSLGYGAYHFYLDSPVDNPDPNVVLGLFTWSDNPADNNREMDIEFSRWGDKNNLNAQYVVQPYTLPPNIFRFQEPSGLSQSTHSLTWTNGSVLFRSMSGFYQPPPAVNAYFQQKAFTEGVPPPGDENARMNLWLYQGRAPANRQPVEVIINKFEFAPQ